MPRRDLQARDARQPRRQQALLQGPGQRGTFCAIVQRDLERDLTGGDMRQGPQNLDIACSPVAWHVVGHAERAHDMAVRSAHREPCPGDHPGRPGRAPSDGARVQPDVVDDQLCRGVDHVQGRGH